MRELSVERIKIGEHILVDGVEYVAEEGCECEECPMTLGGSALCGFCPIGGHIVKVKKEPKYRPYRDTEEMIADWKERFKRKWSETSMPLIWIWDKDKVEKTLVIGFRRQGVKTADTIIHMASLLQSYTYLDGSPCGKEVTE